MSKLSSKYVCQQCSYESPRWFGKCPECGSWNTAVETVVSTSKTPRFQNSKSPSGNKPISLEEVPKNSTARISSQISELDRVLGGGLVAGQVTLIAGEPGIGKSTLLLQVADRLGTRHEALGREEVSKTSDYSLVSSASVLYVSGEESVGQIAIRAKRLGIKNKNIQLLEDTDIDSVINTVDNSQGENLQGVIVDSIQTMQTTDLSGMAGSVGQVRECAYRLVKLAKSKGIPVFIIGHVTKEGTIAGPSVLMHIVDTVLWFEGDKTLSVRLLRAVKNRFGPTDEVGIFSMGDVGLIPENHPEKIFLSEMKKAVPGSVISAVINGTRPLLVEMQSLIVPSKLAIPRRVAQGIDSKKVELLLAVISRRCGLPLYESDVYVSVMGGISVRNDPSVDLAVCLSLASGYFNKPVDRKTVVFGEVGLLGEIREVTLQEKRVKEAKRLGYSNFVTSVRYDFLQKAIKELFR
jgi:DNA repair protein RadA/Sms